MKLKFDLSYHPFMFFVAFLLFLLPISLSVEMRYHIKIVGYVDELICVLSIVYYIVYFFYLKKSRIYDFLLFVLLMAVAVIGLISNARSKLINNWFPVVVDAICLLKIFLPFLICIKIGKSDKGMFIVKYLEPVGKILILLGTFFGTISQFVNIGMTDSERRYGMAPFYFVFQNEGRYGYIIAVFLAVILIVEPDKRKRIIYSVLAVINMIYTTKGVVYVALVCYIVLLIMWRNKNKLTFSNIALLSVAGIAISTLQIESYIKDFNSPRMRLLRYGFITANRYFPLGSGFATYGSDMALKNYSALYDFYGFNNYYGLSREVGTCLNDCYLGMVVGQFGYIGAVLYIALIVISFIYVNTIKINNNVKALCFAIFVGIIVSSIGTAIIKSSIGVMVFAFLGLICGYSQQDKYRLIGTKTEEQK